MLNSTGTKPQQDTKHDKTTNYEPCAWLLGYTVITQWSQKHPKPRPHGWAMGRLTWKQNSESPENCL